VRELGAIGGRFEAVVATHLDRGHLHNHIVWNSVSHADGKMAHYQKSFLYDSVRAASDELCRNRVNYGIATKYAEVLRLLGQEARSVAWEEAGKLSKALAAPYKAQKSALLGLKKAIGKAIDKLDALETATDNRANRVREPEEPSLLQELAETRELVERRKLKIPTPERVKSKAAEL
jgi:hypothetical protein